MRVRQSLWCLIGLLLTGCAGYQLGPVNGEHAGARSVQILPFPNQTLEPNLTDAVTTEMRRRLQEDGTYRLSTHGDADIILTGVIKSYHRTLLTLDPTDAQTFRDFRITITADVTARSQAGDVIFTQTVTGYAMARAANDLPLSERQALPLAAGSLAKNVISLLAEGKWW